MRLSVELFSNGHLGRKWAEWAVADLVSRSQGGSLLRWDVAPRT